MAQTFLCYLHKPGALTPDLRIVSCRSREKLPDAIMVELPTWGQFEMIDVYDERDRRLFSFTESPRPVN
jgi:hypothetical protein